MHPTLFKIGSFEVPSFGVMMVLAFLAGMWLATIRAKRYGLNATLVQDMAFWVLIFGILGARVVFIVQELPHYLANPKELMTLRFQGLTSFGGLIFGAITVIVWSARHKISVVRMLDLCAPAFIIGHAVGRFGCLLNGCCFGGVCPADTPWGIHIAGRPVIELHHPAQVYDAAMNFAALAVLLLVERRKTLHLGQLAGLALVLHGITRFVYEFWRAGTDAQVDQGLASSTYWGKLPITQAQGFATVVILVGAGLMVAFRKTALLSEIAVEGVTA